jgi:hypothetical protein
VQPTVTGITLTTSDIDANHAALKELGVDVDARCREWASRFHRCSGSMTRPGTH